MIIRIRGITEEQSRLGKTYWKLQTDKGDMSVFDKPIADKLYEAWKASKDIEVDVKASDDGKYVNIRGLITQKSPQAQADYEEASRNYEATMVKPQDLGKVIKPYGNQEFKIAEEKQFNPTSMYVSYAKDIFCELWNQGEGDTKDIMIRAINLVKQAHKAFS